MYMFCVTHRRILVNSFSLVWFKPGRILVNINLFRSLSMLAEPSLSMTLKFKNTQFYVTYNLQSLISGYYDVYYNTFDKCCFQQTWLDFWKLMKLPLEM